MTARQKFWLRVALTATFPIWFLPAIALSAVGLAIYLIWFGVGELVDPKPRHVGGKCAP